MSGLIDRIQGEPAASEERPLVLDVVGEESDEVLDALAAETRRRVFRELFETPGTASDLADRMDTSVQNVHYHLSNLEAAGLIEPVDTRYSEKGNEMAIYGPASDPIVLVGNEDVAPDVERSLTQIVAGLGLLAGASLLVQAGVERLARGMRLGSDAAAPASNADATAPEGTLAHLVLDVLEPGVVFFTGTLVVVALVVVARQYASS
jgi:DNA-binding transcriptional ArsR family regulator